MEDLVELFKALGDTSRLKLVRLLADDEYCVCELVEILGCSQPSVSQHLAKLKAAGVVRERRQGQWTYYRLVPGLPERLQTSLTALLHRSIDALPVMAEEAARLSTLDRVNCCR